MRWSPGSEGSTFETSGTSHPLSRRHIPEDLTPLWTDQDIRLFNRYCFNWGYPVRALPLWLPQVQSQIYTDVTCLSSVRRVTPYCHEVGTSMSEEHTAHAWTGVKMVALYSIRMFVPTSPFIKSKTYRRGSCIFILWWVLDAKCSRKINFVSVAKSRERSMNSLRFATIFWWTGVVLLMSPLM